VSAAEYERESDVRKVVCTRQYKLHNARWQKDGVMRVLITSDTRTGAKQFQILSMEAEGLQKKVFLKLLEEEIESSDHQDSTENADITSANYDFELAGSETKNRRTYLIMHLKPKRSSKYLIAGKAWIDPEEHAIVRVEGRTARSLSFWIGKPQITQSFRKVEDVWVSDANHSVSDVRFLGRTELTIDFGDYKILRDARVARGSDRRGL